jgi:hypothetical protein
MPVSYAVAVSVWRLVMQLLTEARMWVLRVTMPVNAL